MPQYIVTMTTMVIDADDADAAIARAGDVSGNHWEATDVTDDPRATMHNVVSDEGATFTPWTDGRAVGFKITAEGQPTRYIYLNPSGSCDTGNILDSDVFVYSGAAGDPVEDGTICFVNVWDKLHTSYYTSEDYPVGGTWSVYSEQSYLDHDDEPIDGSQRLIESGFPDMATAEARARKLFEEGQ